MKVNSIYFRDTASANIKINVKCSFISDIFMNKQIISWVNIFFYPLGRDYQVDEGEVFKKKLWWS